MARPLRIEYTGAHYHVTNRGNQRMTVFCGKAEYKLFLEKLEHFAGLFRVRVFCYCCMENHFHLYVRTEAANLSRFMQSFLTWFQERRRFLSRVNTVLGSGREKSMTPLTYCLSILLVCLGASAFATAIGVFTPAGRIRRGGGWISDGIGRTIASAGFSTNWEKASKSRLAR